MSDNIRVPQSSAEFYQQNGLFETPEYWWEVCRLFRARCSVDDCTNLARMRTYIEQGHLVVVRPALLAAPPAAQPTGELAEKLLGIADRIWYGKPTTRADCAVLGEVASLIEPRDTQTAQPLPQALNERTHGITGENTNANIVDLYTQDIDNKRENK